MTFLPALLPALAMLLLDGPGCVAVSPGSGGIVLGDLAPGFPPLAISAPDTPVALAPAPGVLRRFQVPELRRIAVRFHLEAQPEREVCVLRPVSPPQPERFLAAMRAQSPEASIELLDFSRWPVPEGRLEFPLSGLRQGYWRGNVLYAGSQRFAVWAKVKLEIAATRVVAARDLAPGRTIEASALRLESLQVSPGAGRYPESIAEVAGKLPRRAVPAGTAIRAEWLEIPPLIARGETVQVEVRSGAALIQLEGQALAAGAAGQTIPVLNPITGKGFRARIQGPGRVLVESVR